MGMIFRLGISRSIKDLGEKNSNIKFYASFQSCRMTFLLILLDNLDLGTLLLSRGYLGTLLLSRGLNRIKMTINSVQ